MAIIPKQIGWSQESNLIWEVLRQLDQLTKVTSTSGGGGCGDCPVAVNGTTITGNGTVANPLVATINPGDTVIPYNGGGVLADSVITNLGSAPGISVAGYVDVNQYFVTNVHTESAVDASGGYVLPSPGNYIISDSTTGGSLLDFPDPSLFPGAEIFIVISDATNCDLATTYQIVSVTGSVVTSPLTSLAGYSTYIFKSSGVKWYGGQLV
jgi:hypothetical protein